MDNKPSENKAKIYQDFDITQSPTSEKMPEKDSDNASVIQPNGTDQGESNYSDSTVNSKTSDKFVDISSAKNNSSKPMPIHTKRAINSFKFGISAVALSVIVIIFTNINRSESGIEGIGAAFILFPIFYIIFPFVVVTTLYNSVKALQEENTRSKTKLIKAILFTVITMLLALLAWLLSVAFNNF